jgi:hypothetical protein
MKTPFLIFKKRQSTIILRMFDDWLVSVKETKQGKVVWDALIILSDVKKFISRREREGYTYMRRTIL